MAKRYKYTVRKHDEAPGGTLSLVLAVLSFLFLAGSMITAAVQNGQGAIWLGAFGLMSMAFSVYGFIMGIKSLKNQQKSHRLGVIGSLLCGVLAVIWLGIFLTGVSG